MKHVKFLLFFLSVGYVQITSGQTLLGSSKAVIYDAKLVEEKELIIANLADEIQLWNYKSKSLLTSWKTSRIISIDYFDNKVAGVSKSGDIAIWDIATGRSLLQQNISASPLISIAWIDSVSLAVGSENGDLLKINSITGEIMFAIKNNGAVTTIVRGQDNTLIVGNKSGLISVYSRNNLKLENSVQAHKGLIRDIAASDSSHFFITASDDGRYKKWKSGKEITYVDKRTLGSWLLCTDYVDSRSDLIAIGKSNGEIAFFTRFGTYTYKFNSLINSIDIVEEDLPKIILIVATHGEGLYVLDAGSMKLKSRK